MTEKEKRRFNQMADADKKVRPLLEYMMIRSIAWMTKLSLVPVLFRKFIIILYIYPLQRYDVEMACYGNNAPSGPLMKSAKRTKKKKDPNAPKRSM